MTAATLDERIIRTVDDESGATALQVAELLNEDNRLVATRVGRMVSSGRLKYRGNDLVIGDGFPLGAAPAANPSSMDDRIIEAVADGATTSPEIAETLGVAPRTVMANIGRLLGNGKLICSGNALTVPERVSAIRPDSDPDHIGDVTEMVDQKAASPDLDVEDDRVVCFSIDEDGDLQISRRDGEGETMVVPGPEVDRLIEFVARIKAALREAL